MELIRQSGVAVFDPQAIRRGDLLRARYNGWNEARNGLVFRMEPERLTVQFMPAVGNVSAFYVIQAGEVERGEWEILWSRDLETVERTGGAESDP